MLFQPRNLVGKSCGNRNRVLSCNSSRFGWWFWWVKIMFYANWAGCHAGGQNVVMLDKTLQKDKSNTRLTIGWKEDVTKSKVTKWKKSMSVFRWNISENDRVNVHLFHYDFGMWMGKKQIYWWKLTWLSVPSWKIHQYHPARTIQWRHFHKRSTRLINYYWDFEIWICSNLDMLSVVTSFLWWWKKYVSTFGCFV